MILNVNLVAAGYNVTTERLGNEHATFSEFSFYVIIESLAFQWELFCKYDLFRLRCLCCL